MTIIYEDLPVIYDTGELLQDSTDWRTLKLKSQAVSKVLDDSDKYWLKRSERMLSCGSILRFAVGQKGDKRLISATFCKDRLCPACQKRRSLAMFHQVKDVCIALQNDNPTMQYLLLTLTVPNVKIASLSAEMTKMNKAWLKLSKRKEFTLAVKGWFKALEVTHNAKADTYHPHFHILLAVPASYFTSRYYIKHSRWLELWQDSMRNSLITQIDVRKVKPNPKREGTAIESAAAEVGKYATKPSDYLTKLPDGDYLANKKVVRELAIALKGRRLTAYGGLMAEYYSKLQLADIESEEVDLVHLTDTNDQIEAVMVQVFKWNIGLKQYLN